MPFVFLILGILFVIVAIQGTQSDAFKLLKSEFTGSNNFIVFVSAIAVLGAVGYIPPLKKPADAMILLVLLAMVLANKGGVFQQFNDAIRSPIGPTTLTDPAGPQSSQHIAPDAAGSTPSASAPAYNPSPTAVLNPSSGGVSAGINAAGNSLWSIFKSLLPSGSTLGNLFGN